VRGRSVLQSLVGHGRSRPGLMITPSQSPPADRRSVTLGVRCGCGEAAASGRGRRGVSRRVAAARRGLLAAPTQDLDRFAFGRPWGRIRDALAGRVAAPDGEEARGARRASPRGVARALLRPGVFGWSGILRDGGRPSVHGACAISVRRGRGIPVRVAAAGGHLLSVTAAKQLDGQALGCSRRWILDALAGRIAASDGKVAGGARGASAVCAARASIRAGVRPRIRRVRGSAAVAVALSCRRRGGVSARKTAAGRHSLSVTTAEQLDRVAHGCFGRRVLEALPRRPATSDGIKTCRSGCARLVGSTCGARAAVGRIRSSRVRSRAAGRAERSTAAKGCEAYEDRSSKPERRTR
jgi:hypothetical protein